MATLHLKSMKQCPHCHHLIPASRPLCPYCQDKTFTQRPAVAVATPTPVATTMLPRSAAKVSSNSKTLLWVMLGIAVVVIGVVVGLLLSKDKGAESSPIDFTDEATEEVYAEAAVEESLADEYLGTYKGTLNGSIGITVHLRYTDGDQIYGSYYYGNGSYGSLDLSGNVNSYGMSLEESDSSGNTSGYWQCEKSGDEIVGTMTNAKGREFSVHLIQVD